MPSCGVDARRIAAGIHKSSLAPGVRGKYDLHVEAPSKGDVHNLYWSLQRQGFSEEEAGNLCALAFGLDVHERQVAWTWQEIAHEVFWRELVRRKLVQS